MKTVTVFLLLSSMLVASEAWFMDFKSWKADKESKKKTTTSTPRKVVLVAKKVYVPMYVSDDVETPVSDKLLPISPVLTAPAGVDNRQQPIGQIDYSMYLQPPPMAYPMYVPGSTNVAVAAAYAQDPVAVAAEAAPQYAVYQTEYGAAGPPYMQFGAAAPYSQYAAVPETWMVQYGAAEAEVPAAPYPPTGSETEVVEDPATVPTDAYTPA